MSFLKLVCVSSCIGGLLPLVLSADSLPISEGGTPLFASLFADFRGGDTRQNAHSDISHSDISLDAHSITLGALSLRRRHQFIVDVPSLDYVSLQARNVFRTTIHSISPPAFLASSLPSARYTLPVPDGRGLPVRVNESQYDAPFMAFESSRPEESLMQVSRHVSSSPLIIQSLVRESDAVVDVALVSSERVGLSLESTLFSLNRSGLKLYSSSHLEHCDLSSASGDADSTRVKADLEGEGDTGAGHHNETPEARNGNATHAPMAIAQVRVNRYVVAEFSQQGQAYHFAEAIKDLLASDDFHPGTLVPQTDGQEVVIASEGEDIAIPPTVADLVGHRPTLLAIAWTNNLRVALGVEPLSMGDAQATLQSLEANGQIVKGIASWYGPYFHGRLTASGERFDQHALTAAHPFLPFDTYLKVTNLQNGRSVVVRINDRGPYIGRRSLDLSWRAAKCLDSEESGVVPYVATLLEKEPSLVAASPSFSIP